MIRYLTREEVKNGDISNIFNLHKREGGDTFSVPGDIVQKLWITKPTSYYGCQLIMCPHMEENFLAMFFVAPTGRIITVTAQGIDRDGQTYGFDES